MKFTIARLTDEERRDWNKWEGSGRPKGIKTTPCKHPACTGVHDGNKPYATWCPAMKERKRHRDMAWYYRIGGKRLHKRQFKQTLWRLRRQMERNEQRIAELDVS